MNRMSELSWWSTWVGYTCDIDVRCHFTYDLAPCHTDRSDFFDNFINVRNETVNIKYCNRLLSKGALNTATSPT